LVKSLPCHLPKTERLNYGEVLCQNEKKSITLPQGLYAVFVHKGAASEGPKTYQYILGAWLPNSDFKLDNRPHFAIRGEKYKSEDPDSEEELWIPIKAKE
jgi:AraC family transcriptional regulator